MESKVKGWVLINIGHPRTKSSFISSGSFSYRRKDVIAEFVSGSGFPWSYWRDKYNFRCVKATQIITTETTEGK